MTVSPKVKELVEKLDKESKERFDPLAYPFIFATRGKILQLIGLLHPDERTVVADQIKQITDCCDVERGAKGE